MIKADFKNDYFPFFNITNSLFNAAITFCRYKSLFQMVPTRPQNHWLNQKKKNRIEIWSAIQLFVRYYLDIMITKLKWFCLKNNNLKLFYKLSSVVRHLNFFAVMIAIFEDGLKNRFFAIQQCLIVEFNDRHAYYLQPVERILHALNKGDRKTSEQLGK